MDGHSLFPVKIKPGRVFKEKEREKDQTTTIRASHPFYRKAAKATPARPTLRPTGPAVWTAPAPVEPEREDEESKSSVGEGL